MQCRIVCYVYTLRVLGVWLSSSKFSLLLYKFKKKGKMLLLFCVQHHTLCSKDLSSFAD